MVASDISFFNLLYIILHSLLILMTLLVWLNLEYFKIFIYSWFKFNVVQSLLVLKGIKDNFRIPEIY